MEKYRCLLAISLIVGFVACKGKAEEKKAETPIEPIATSTIKEVSMDTLTIENVKVKDVAVLTKEKNAESKAAVNEAVVEIPVAKKNAAEKNLLLSKYLL